MALRFAAAKLIRDKKSDQDQSYRAKVYKDFQFLFILLKFKPKIIKLVIFRDMMEIFVKDCIDGSSSSLNSSVGKSCNSGSKVFPGLAIAFKC